MACRLLKELGSLGKGERGMAAFPLPGKCDKLERGVKNWTISCSQEHSFSWSLLNSPEGWART